MSPLNAAVFDFGMTGEPSRRMKVFSLTAFGSPSSRRPRLKNVPNPFFEGRQQHSIYRLDSVDAQR